MFSKSVEDLMRDIANLATKEVKLIERKRVAIARVAAVQEAAGAALVDAPEGESTDGSAASIARANEDVSIVEAAVRTCRARRFEAIKTRRDADATALRKQVAELQGEVKRILAEVEKHLVAVAELEQTRFQTVLAPFCDPPRTAQLGVQIEAAQRRIASLTDEVPCHGIVDLQEARGMDALIAAVLAHESDSPTAEAVISWANACAGGRQFAELPRRYYVVWRDAVIDAAESYVLVPSLATRAVGATAGTPIFDLSRTTFRAPAGWQQPCELRAQRAKPPEIQPEPESQEAKPREVAQPQPGASRWVDAPRREKDEGPDWVPAPGAGSGARP